MSSTVLMIPLAAEGSCSSSGPPPQMSQPEEGHTGGACLDLHLMLSFEPLNAVAAIRQGNCTTALQWYRTSIFGVAISKRFSGRACSFPFPTHCLRCSDAANANESLPPDSMTCQHLLHFVVAVPPAPLIAALACSPCYNGGVPSCTAGLSEWGLSETAAAVWWPTSSLRQCGRPVACCRLRWVLRVQSPALQAPAASAGGPAGLSSNHFGCQMTAEWLFSNVCLRTLCGQHRVWCHLVPLCWCVPVECEAYSRA